MGTKKKKDNWLSEREREKMKENERKNMRGNVRGKKEDEKTRVKGTDQYTGESSTENPSCH